MNLFLAVTDNDWFRFLRSQDSVDEVNFWRPGGEAGFRALSPGEPFLFKLHSPEDFEGVGRVGVDRGAAGLVAEHRPGQGLRHALGRGGEAVGGREGCSVTGEKALPALDAAHIRAAAEGGQHRMDNGLLLRSDVHRLFDAGYVTVTPEHRFRVSRSLKDEFGSTSKGGEPYFPFDGRELWLPPEPRERPNRELLEWHGDVVFRG